MPRQVITQVEVEAALASGTTTLHIDNNAIVTAVAAETAMDRGLTLSRSAPGEATPPAAKQEAAAAPDAAAQRREEVRAAVIARLGSVPASLDVVLDRVLGS